MYLLDVLGYIFGYIWIYSHVLIAAFFVGNRPQQMSLPNQKNQINNFAGGENATLQLNIPTRSKIYKDRCEFGIPWILLELYIGMQVFMNFIKSHFYVITRSWHAHQKIRIDELIWTKLVQFVFITKMIEQSTKPFENLLFWTCWKNAYALLYLNKNAYAK